MLFEDTVHGPVLFHW